MGNSPIDDTLDRIDRGYQPGCLPWVKRKRPNEWRRMITLETEINRLAFLGDEAGLKKILDEYEGFVLDMVKAFNTPTQETGSLFLNL